MTLSVIIVSYNTANLTLGSIASAWDDAQASSMLKGKTEFIVVDNHSQDDSLKLLNKFKKEKASSNIIIISKQKNLGFAAANNLAIKKARGKYILLLNSDTFVQPKALELLFTHHQQASRHQKIAHLGILAATLLNTDGTLQPQGGDLPTLFSLFTHMTLLDDLPFFGKLLPSVQHTGYRQTETLKKSSLDVLLTKRGWVAGTAVLIKKQVFEEIGLLDENIFMYGEDVEFCLRAKNHHWETAIDPSAKITHLGSASSSSSNAIKGEFNAYLYIWSKHKPLWQIPLVKMILKLGAALRWFLFGTIFRDNHKMKVYQNLLFQI
jgi:GT2 family glycosyltransferase